MTPSPAGPVIATCIALGLLFSFWFYVSSTFLVNGKLDLTKGSIMPIKCVIAPDRAADSKATGTAYFWQDNVRIDVDTFNVDKGRSHAHEIISPNNTAYVWMEGAEYGSRTENVQDFPIFANISTVNAWFCWPWLVLDYHLFEVPKSVTFQ